MLSRVSGKLLAGKLHFRFQPYSMREGKLSKLVSYRPGRGPGPNARQRNTSTDISTQVRLCPGVHANTVKPGSLRFMHCLHGLSTKKPLLYTRSANSRAFKWTYELGRATLAPLALRFIEFQVTHRRPCAPTRVRKVESKSSIRRSNSVEQFSPIIVPFRQEHSIDKINHGFLS